MHEKIKPFRQIHARDIPYTQSTNHQFLPNNSLLPLAHEIESLPGRYLSCRGSHVWWRYSWWNPECLPEQRTKTTADSFYLVSLGAIIKDLQWHDATRNALDETKCFDSGGVSSPVAVAPAPIGKGGDRAIYWPCVSFPFHVFWFKFVWYFHTSTEE